MSARASAIKARPPPPHTHTTRADAGVSRKGMVAEGRATAMTLFRHILLIRFMTFISVISCITLISLIRIMARCIKILALKITRLLPKPFMTWAISFVLPCAQAGFPTSGQHHPCCRPARGAGHVGASRLSRSCFCLLLTLISRDVICF